MSQTKVPKYRIEIIDHQGQHSFSWTGPANNKQLASWVSAYVSSLQPGGVNAHLSSSLGFVPFPHYARLVEQTHGITVAEWSAPSFVHN